MRTRLLTSFVTIALCSISAFSSQKDCSALFRGRYVNSDHGYSFAVPSGLGGQWQSSCTYDELLRDCICMGSHGLYVALSKTSGINVFSAYPVELDDEKPTQAQILTSMVKAQREAGKELGATALSVESVIVRNNWARRVSMRWVDAESKRPMKKVSFLFVTRVNGSEWPSAEVTVSLVAPEAEFDARIPLLDEVLQGFKWLRD